MKLIDIKGKSVKDALPILLSAENALDYGNMLEELYYTFPNRTWTKRIAEYLCGTSGRIMAINFMVGYGDGEEFINNVAYNSEDSIPVIIKAIQLHYMNEADILASDEG
jgi:hypothetical protein